MIKFTRPRIIDDVKFNKKQWEIVTRMFNELRKNEADIRELKKKWGSRK